MTSRKVTAGPSHKKEGPPGKDPVSVTETLLKSFYDPDLLPLTSPCLFYHKDDESTTGKRTNWSTDNPG